MVPERQLRQKGRAPSHYRTKKVGRKEEPRRRLRNGIFTRRDEIPKAGQEQSVAEAYPAKPSRLGVSRLDPSKLALPKGADFKREHFTPGLFGNVRRHFWLSQLGKGCYWY